MRKTTTRLLRLLATWILAVAVTASPLSGLADEPGQTIPEPGFRPDSAYAAAFLDSTSSTKVAVLPTIVRRTDRTAHSFASQKQLVALLNESGILAAESKPLRIKMPELRRPSQWEIFEFGIDSVAARLETYASGTDYVLVLEFLVPGDRDVFGIEVYILDSQGKNAFSFLLNSHHRMFAEAKLSAQDSSEDARRKMIEDATRLAVLAISAQIEAAAQPKAIASHMVISETPIDDASSRLTIDPSESEGLAAEKAMALTCECAKLTVDRGFRYFRIDERAELPDGRGSFRIHFYATPPEGVLVVDTTPDRPLALGPDVADAALDAEEFLRICGMLSGQPDAPTNP